MRKGFSNGLVQSLTFSRSPAFPAFSACNVCRCDSYRQQATGSASPIAALAQDNLKMTMLLLLAYLLYVDLFCPTWEPFLCLCRPLSTLGYVSIDPFKNIIIALDREVLLAESISRA
jgi:hypothetical protein